MFYHLIFLYIIIFVDQLDHQYWDKSSDTEVTTTKNVLHILNFL